MLILSRILLFLSVVMLALSVVQGVVAVLGEQYLAACSMAICAAANSFNVYASLCNIKKIKWLKNEAD